MGERRAPGHGWAVAVLAVALSPGTFGLSALGADIPSPSIGIATAWIHGAPEPEIVVVEGEIVDLACLVAHGARGRDNAVCAEHHAIVEQPLALVATDGAVHVLYAYAGNSFAYEHARARIGTVVRAEGVHAERGGLQVLELRRVTPGRRDAPDDGASATRHPPREEATR